MIQGEMAVTETRMGKLEAFDGAEEETVDQQYIMQQTMGVVAFPKGAFEHEQQPDKVVEKVDKAAEQAKQAESKAKSKKLVPPVQQKTPAHSLRRR